MLFSFVCEGEWGGYSCIIQSPQGGFTQAICLRFKYFFFFSFSHMTGFSGFEYTATWDEHVDYFLRGMVEGGSWFHHIKHWFG